MKPFKQRKPFGFRGGGQQPRCPTKLRKTGGSIQGRRNVYLPLETHYLQIGGRVRRRFPFLFLTLIELEALCFFVYNLPRVIHLSRSLCATISTSTCCIGCLSTQDQTCALACVCVSSFVCFLFAVNLLFRWPPPRCDGLQPKGFDYQPFS